MIKMNGKIGKIGFSYFSKSVCVLLICIGCGTRMDDKIIKINLSLF